MSIWGRLSATAQPEYDEAALAGAGAIASWQAALLRGPFTAAGGRLVLTEPALIFSPLDMSGTLQLMKVILSAVEIPGEQTLTQLAAGMQHAPISVALANIASLEPTGGARWLTPPSLKLVTKVGSVYNFGVLAGFGYPSKSKENEVALTDLLQQVKSHIPAA